MSKDLRPGALIPVILMLAGMALAASTARLSVELPASNAVFPPGDGADIANGQCLICHSAGMVLRQPALTQDQWTAEINKMRNAYGALLPANQVEPLARYLHGINGRSSADGRSAVDESGS
jgi:mono/diheme cytochrome c family protein